MLVSLKSAVCLLFVHPVISFSISGRSASLFRWARTTATSSTMRLAASTDETSKSSAETTNLLSLTLEKPLGLILEEVEEGADKGVKVQEVGEGGSAFQSEYKETLPGLVLATVNSENVLNLNFDAVMEKILEAPSPVEISFKYEQAAAEEGSTDEDSSAEPEFEVGTGVTINVIQEGKPDMAIDAKVGDNLRKVLLENKVELYRGLKKKTMNCNGNGQCTFCAVDFVESQGWSERSEYEDGKIGKWPRARLACLNNIQGPATIRVQ